MKVWHLPTQRCTTPALLFCLVVGMLAGPHTAPRVLARAGQSLAQAVPPAVNCDTTAIREIKDKAEAKLSRLLRLWILVTALYEDSNRIIPAVNPELSSAKGELYQALDQLGLQLLDVADVVADPADPQYRSIAGPVLQPVPALQPSGGTTPAVATALTALVSNAAETHAYVGALVTANNRAQGAATARDTAWELRQLWAAGQYAAQVSSRTAAEPRLRARFRQALQRAGVSIVLTVADQQAARQQIATAGLPPAVRQELTQDGADASQLAGLVAAIRAAPAPTEAARFPDLLGDPALDQATTAAAVAFGQYATAATGCALTPVTAVPTPGAPQQPTKLTLTVNGVAATDTTTDRSHRFGTLMLRVGTPLTVQAVTDAPMPTGWHLLVHHNGERDPKTGGWLQICQTETTTCSAMRPGLTTPGGDEVWANVAAPTYNALEADINITWTKP